MRPLFSDAPVLPAAPVIPSVSGTSPLAAALSRPPQVPYLPPANFAAIPLASMMQAAQGTGDQVTSNTPD